MTSTPQTPIINAGNIYVNGLQLARFDNTNLRIMPGIARDASNINDLVSLAVGNVSTAFVGLNGLDAGTIAANLYYAVFIIGDSTKYRPTGFLISLDPLSPILPKGYDMYRRIGWVRTDGSSNLLAFIATGSGVSRKYTYLSPLTAVTGGTATSFAAGAVNLTSLALIPNFQVYTPNSLGLGTTIGMTEITLNSVYTAAAATNDLDFAVLPGSAGPVVSVKTGVAAAQEFQTVLPVLTGGSGTSFNYRVVAGDSVDIALSAYTDSLF